MTDSRPANQSPNVLARYYVSQYGGAHTSSEGLILLFVMVEMFDNDCLEKELMRVF